MEPALRLLLLINPEEPSSSLIDLANRLPKQVILGKFHQGFCIDISSKQSIQSFEKRRGPNVALEQ